MLYPRTDSNQNYHILAIVTITVLISYLHFGTVQPFSHRVVFEELYYLPLLLAVLRFGLRGSIVAWLFVSAAYLPFFFGHWATTFPELVDRILHLVFTGLFVFVASFLAERERNSRKQVEQDRYLAGIGQVATVIVHDLKNPLVSIIGFARRIREGKGDAVLGAQTIEDSAENMQKIVNSVLDFAKPLKLDRAIVDIRDCVNRAVDACRAKARGMGVSISVRFPSNPVTAEIDTSHLERGMVNLIDNAVDASRSGGEVTVSADATAHEMVVKIKDQGMGMDSEAVASMFMPYFTTKNEGTGLGMPIAKKVIEAHGGALYVTSKLGTGTEVSIRLPL
jgi:signal transduction histidine kinase